MIVTFFVIVEVYRLGLDLERLVHTRMSVSRSYHWMMWQLNLQGYDLVHVLSILFSQ